MDKTLNRLFFIIHLLFRINDSVERARTEEKLYDTQWVVLEEKNDD